MTTEIASSLPARKFVVLAPWETAIPSSFEAVYHDREVHAKLMSRMQQLRGRIYLEDGAITSSHLDSEGRHHMPGDAESWHLLRTRDDGSVSGCARILVHPRNVLYSQLRVASSALAKCPTWGPALRNCMELEIANAAKTGEYVTEPGGWALAEDLRGTTEALAIAVGALAWGQICGGSVGLMTATARHGSATMLRRLGGKPVELEGRPPAPYFDSSYGCEMELLRFESQALNSRFATLLERTRQLLVNSTVIEATSSHSSRIAA